MIHELTSKDTENIEISATKYMGTIKFTAVELFVVVLLMVLSIFFRYSFYSFSAFHKFANYFANLQSKFSYFPKVSFSPLFVFLAKFYPKL